MKIPFLHPLFSCWDIGSDWHLIGKSTGEYSRTSTSISGAAALLLLPLLAFSGNAYAQVISGDYIVFDAGTSWKWLVTVNGTVVDEVDSAIADETTPINGVDAVALEFSDGSNFFFSEEQDGYRIHRLFQPSAVELQPGVFVDITITFDPGVVFVGQVVEPGDTFSGSGTATVELAGVGTGSVPYQSESTFVGIDSVSVPAGDFTDTMHLDSSFSLSGTLLGQPFAQVQTFEQWVGRAVGFVKFIQAVDGVGATYELLAANTHKDDIVMDFGGIGLWARMNDASWLKLSNSSPDQAVTGDMDGNGHDDVIADFSSTLGGIFVKYNLGSWRQLHNLSAELMAVGDLDANGKDDVIIDFGGIGLWARMNDASWLKLSNSSPDQIVTGDMDGNGADDVIAVFSSGIFVKRNLGAWAQLHNGVPEAMTVGDLDNSDRDDVVIDFGGIGLWARMNDTSWLKLHNGSPELIATGDLDGNRADDVLATFSGLGLWQKLNLGGWSVLSNAAADALVTGDLTGNGQDDIVADFGSTLGGIYVKRDQGVWLKLHNTSPDSMAPGELD